MRNVEELLSDLVKIDSTNPDLIPGAAGEAQAADFVARWMEQAGLEVHMHQALPGRPNVVGIARGTGGGRTLMLNGHTDTVGAGGMPNPHAPVISSGRMYGRGTYDMKGGLAACLVAAEQAARSRLRGDVIVAAVVDEEYAGLGSVDIVRRYQADAAIVAEPTELELIVAHRGFVLMEVETLGVAAHGSRPHLGVDAIVKMGRVLTGLDALDQNLRANPTHPLLGSGSVHASTIRGGHEPSTYPQECVLLLERRTLPGETPDTLEAELQEILDGIRKDDPKFKAVLRRVMDRPPMETPEGAEIVPVLRAAAEKVLGRSLEKQGVSYWTDAATLLGAGIPPLLFGPLGAGAHADEEWVDLDSVRACAEIYLETALKFCS